MGRVTNILRETKETPWYVFLIDDASCWLCDHIPAIRLFRSPMTDQDAQQTTWREYWGNLRQWWHAKVRCHLFG